MKKAKGVAVLLIFLAIGLFAFYLFWMCPRYTVPILTYHGFGNAGIQVPPGDFEKQMRYLKVKGCKVISLDELVEGIKSRSKFARNTVVITFDDGYKDNFTIAYPILKKYGFPATIFLVSKNIGTAPNFLDWDQVREMSRNNISFGGHTKSHAYLPSVEDRDVLRGEIFSCKRTIESRIGIPVDYFSYPIGGWTKEAQMLLRQAGYKGACTTNRGGDRLNRDDVYALNRISIRRGDPYFSFNNIANPISFRGKISGYYNCFRKKR